MPRASCQSSSGTAANARQAAGFRFAAIATSQPNPTASRGARRHRRPGEQRTTRVGPDPVQPGQAVRPDQLSRRHPHQQLPAGQPPVAVLDRPDPAIQLGNHPQPAGQLIHRSSWVSDGTRTRDPRDHNPMLYQLSYAHH
jgi:hypothetical protein